MSYHGEVAGLKLATEFITSLSTSHTFSKAHIFCDCKSAIASVSSTKQSNSLQECITKIQRNINHLKTEKGITTHIYWIPGHANLTPNELADTAAKTAAQEAVRSDLPPVYSLQLVKRVIRNHIHTKWQRSWDRQAEGGVNHYHRHTPKAPTTRYKSMGSRAAEAKLMRLQTNHSRLNNHLHKLFPEESPCCDCSNERQTPHHILMDCPIVKDERSRMVNEVELTYTRHKTPCWERTVTMSDLLFPCHTDPATKHAITKAVLRFLSAIRTKINI